MTFNPILYREAVLPTANNKYEIFLEDESTKTRAAEFAVKFIKDHYENPQYAQEVMKDCEFKGAVHKEAVPPTPVARKSSCHRTAMWMVASVVILAACTLGLGMLQRQGVLG